MDNWIVLYNLLLIVVSCKKNDIAQSTAQGELEEWYNKNRPINQTSFRDMKPIWDSVYLNEQADQLVYELRLSNPKNVYQASDSGNSVDKYNAHSRNDIRLLIFKDKINGQITSGCYMSVLNETSEVQNLKELHYKKAKDLSGKIMFFNMRGRLENGWEYYKGTIVKRINGSLKGYNYGTGLYL